MFRKPRLLLLFGKKINKEGIVALFLKIKAQFAIIVMQKHFLYKIILIEHFVYKSTHSYSALLCSGALCLLCYGALCLQDHSYWALCLQEHELIFSIIVLRSTLFTVLQSTLFTGACRRIGLFILLVLKIPTFVLRKSSNFEILFIFRVTNS